MNDGGEDVSDDADEYVAKIFGGQDSSREYGSSINTIEKGGPAVTVSRL